MILTCPECATSYFVDDARVPATGRAVKCSHCGARWTALPESAPAAPAAPAPRPAPAAAEAPAAETSAADEIVAESPEIEAAAEAVEPAEPAPRRRPAPPPPAPRRRSGGAVLVWVTAAAVVVGLVAGLLVFRGDIVRIIPASREVYAKVGMPANPLGLVIEDVWVDPAFQGGRPVLAVTGQIRNVRDQAVTAPSLRVSLLDKQGRPLSAKVARPIDGHLPAGAVRHFAIAIVDPPAAVHDLKVTFDDTGRGPAAATAPRAAEAVVSGPAPVEARPLPSDSPDALSRHD